MSGRRDRRGLRSVGIASATLLVMLGVPYAVPGMERLRLLEPLPEGQGLVIAPPKKDAPAKVGETKLPAATSADVAHPALPDDVAIPAQAKKVVGDALGETAKPPVPIVDPSGKALDPFFATLADVEAKKPGAFARATMWGDSNVAGDLVSAVLRRELQDRFGDGGHGFVLLTRASRRYHHSDIVMHSADGWAMSRITGPLAKDGRYGLGGTSLRALGKGAFSKLGTTTEGRYGRKVARLSIDHLKQPEGDRIEVLVDGALKTTIDTRADAPESAVAHVDVPDGGHAFHLRTTGSKVRIYGLWLERKQGVVIDAAGVTNSKIQQLDRIDAEHMKRQLAMRGTSLLMFNFGVNEARSGKELFGDFDAYRTSMVATLRKLRAMRPEAGCLVVGPIDIAYESRAGKLLSYPLIADVNRLQREAAAEASCAFWDSRKAMGGDGSMGRWRKADLGEENMLHPTPAGAKILGRWLTLALLERYRAYKRR